MSVFNENNKSEKPLTRAYASIYTKTKSAQPFYTQKMSLFLRGGGLILDSNKDSVEFITEHEGFAIHRQVEKRGNLVFMRAKRRKLVEA